MNNENQKTIFITVIRAEIVRNLLLSGFLDLLKEKYKIVILTPLFDDPEFKEKFSQYELAPLYKNKNSWLKKKLEKSFVAFHKSLIYNPTIEVRMRYGLMLKANDTPLKKIKYLSQKYVLGKFFSYRIFRKLAKSIDRALLSNNIYNEVIDKYNPELVFISSIGSDEEITLLRNCKKRGVRSVAMAKSWDNASKFGFREMADKLMVWSEYMKEEAVNFQDYDEKDIKVVGIPQFDYYKNLELPTKDDFFDKFGLDKNKKTIFFGSEGPVCPDDPYIVGLLKEKIESGTLNNYQVIIRPHFGYKNDPERFFHLVDNKNIFIEKRPPVSKFKDGTELSLDGTINLISEIKYSDVHITSASTLVLDIVAGGRYPILYNFDKNPNAQMKDSVKRLYTTLWFEEIAKIGLDNFVNNEEELINKIKASVDNPQIKESEREEIIRRFCYRVDGNTSKRLFKFIDEELMKNN